MASSGFTFNDVDVKRHPYVQLFGIAQFPISSKTETVLSELKAKSGDYAFFNCNELKVAQIMPQEPGVVSPPEYIVNSLYADKAVREEGILAVPFTSGLIVLFLPEKAGVVQALKQAESGLVAPRKGLKLV